MARPKQTTPTAGELEILGVLWDRGPLTVRQVRDELNRRRPRAYTSVMTLLNVMVEKGLVSREAQGRAYVYRPARPRHATLGRLVKDLLSRAFQGSAAALVAQLLDQTQPSPEELALIRRSIEEYEQKERK